MFSVYFTVRLIGCLYFRLFRSFLFPFSHVTVETSCFLLAELARFLYTRFNA